MLLTMQPNTTQPCPLTSTGSLRTSLSPTSQKKPSDAIVALISADHCEAGNKLLHKAGNKTAQGHCH